MNLVKIHRIILFNYCTLLIGRYCFPVLHKTSYCTRQSPVIVLLHFTMQNKTMFHHFCFGNFFFFLTCDDPFLDVYFFYLLPLANLCFILDCLRHILHFIIKVVNITDDKLQVMIDIDDHQMITLRRQIPSCDL